MVQGWSGQEGDGDTRIVPFPARKSSSVLREPFAAAAEEGRGASLWIPRGAHPGGCIPGTHPEPSWSCFLSPSSRSGPRCPPARSGHRCVADSSNLYVFGGYNPDYDESGGPENEDYPLFRELWRYNFATDTWHQMGTEGYMPRELASMSRTYRNPAPRVLIPGAVLILGILMRARSGNLGPVSSRLGWLCDFSSLFCSVEAEGKKQTGKQEVFSRCLPCWLLSAGRCFVQTSQSIQK